MTQTNRPSVPTPQQQESRSSFAIQASFQEFKGYVQNRLATVERDFHLISFFRRDEMIGVEERQLRIERRQDARVNKLEQELKVMNKKLEEQRLELAELNAKFNELHVNKN